MSTLIYQPYLNSTNFSRPVSDAAPQAIFCCHVSLGSFHLEWFLSALLETASQRIPLILSLPDVSLSFKFYFLGRTKTGACVLLRLSGDTRINVMLPGLLSTKMLPAFPFVLSKCKYVSTLFLTMLFLTVVRSIISSLKQLLLLQGLTVDFLIPSFLLHLLFETPLLRKGSSSSI